MRNNNNNKSTTTSGTSSQRLRALRQRTHGLFAGLAVVGVSACGGSGTASSTTVSASELSPPATVEAAGADTTPPTTAAPTTPVTTTPVATTGATAPATTGAPPATAPVGNERYVNEEVGFSIEVPPNWELMTESSAFVLWNVNDEAGEVIAIAQVKASDFGGTTQEFVDESVANAVVVEIVESGIITGPDGGELAFFESLLPASSGREASRSRTVAVVSDGRVAQASINAEEEFWDAVSTADLDSLNSIRLEP